MANKLSREDVVRGLAQDALMYLEVVDENVGPRRAGDMIQSRKIERNLEALRSCLFKLVGTTRTSDYQPS